MSAYCGIILDRFLLEVVEEASALIEDDSDDFLVSFINEFFGDAIESDFLSFVFI